LFISVISKINVRAHLTYKQIILSEAEQCTKINLLEKLPGEFPGPAKKPYIT
jgi:hypothetical protein